MDGNVVGVIAIGCVASVIILAMVLSFVRGHQKMRHKERLAMIENGIFVEAKQQESGVPSMAIIILVGLFALLFIGVGLIARDRLLRHKKSVTGCLKTGHLESNQLEENRPKQQQAPDDET
ncbi:MAG TPA: hypothetical protein EYQ20_18480 [candidate division Zixibacteria bacterium]|nr:hypothetical protein [candidate division Zixibacteria bacterium]